MKKIKISAYIVFIIGVIAIVIHILALTSYSEVNTKEVKEPKTDSLSIETNNGRNLFPIIELSNNEKYEYEPGYEIEEIVESFVSLTEEEKRDFSALVYLESGGESYECMKTVASVIVNRMMNNNLSLHDVIYATNQFEPARNIPYTTPSEEAVKAVNEIIQNGPCVPRNVTFFRASHYHDWSDLIKPYTVIDNTYFSYDARIEVD